MHSQPTLGTFIFQVRWDPAGTLATNGPHRPAAIRLAGRSFRRGGGGPPLKKKSREKIYSAVFFPLSFCVLVFSAVFVRIFSSPASNEMIPPLPLRFPTKEVEYQGWISQRVKLSSFLSR